MVSLLGILCKARNNPRARDLGDSREEGCQWWCPFWRHPVTIPGPVARTPFSGFSTSGKHPASQGTWGSQSLPASSPLLSLCSFWFTFTHLLAALLCPVVACSGVNFPTASSPIPFIQWFLRLSFKPPVQYHFHADSPEPWAFSQTFTEGFPVLSTLNKLSPIMLSAARWGRRYPYFYKRWNHNLRRLHYLPKFL